MKNITRYLLAGILTLAFVTPALASRPLTPFERIMEARAERALLTIDAEEEDANELITRILDRTNLQYTFIRSPEVRYISLKTKADPIQALQTVAFAAGFNIHRDGDYWVIHPLPPDDGF